MPGYCSRQRRASKWRHGNKIFLAIWVSVLRSLYGSGIANVGHSRLTNTECSSNSRLWLLPRGGQGQYRLDRIRTRLCCFTGRRKLCYLDRPRKDLRLRCDAFVPRPGAAWHETYEVAFRVFRTHAKGVDCAEGCESESGCSGWQNGVSIKCVSSEQASRLCVRGINARPSLQQKVNRQAAA